jgi:NAD(P)H-dependent FMN reductase
MTPTTTPGSPRPDADPLRIVLLVGSVRTTRMAEPLLTWLCDELADVDWIDLDVIDLATIALPITGPRSDRPSPIAARLARADGFLILTPEYNHSYPAALKNAIDWHLQEWAYKPVAFIGYGAHAGGVRAVEHLRGVLPELRATTIREAVLLYSPWQRMTPDGRFQPGDGTISVLQTMLAELRWWARALRLARSQDQLLTA